MTDHTREREEIERLKTDLSSIGTLAATRSEHWQKAEAERARMDEIALKLDSENAVLRAQVETLTDEKIAEFQRYDIAAAERDRAETLLEEARGDLSTLRDQLAQQGPQRALRDEDVEWVVNDIAELGVKIGNQFFFCYKGRSLVYEDATHDDGSPMMWRPVFKREFGECVHPVNYRDPSKVGTVSLDDSDDWKPLPPVLASPDTETT